MDRSNLRLLVFALLLVLPGMARAELIVTPPGTGTAGNSFSTFPFGTASIRYQQAYDRSIFLGKSGVIDEIRFRIDEGYDSFIGTVPDIDLSLTIKLSHTEKEVHALDTTFANNFDGNEIVVFDGIASLSGTSLAGSGPNPLDVVIDIDNTFEYDGSSNLLLEVIHSSGGTGLPYDLYEDLTNPSQIDPTKMSRLSSTTPTATTGSFRANSGLVTGFQFVPEPSSLGLFACGILSLASVRRRKR